MIFHVIQSREHKFLYLDEDKNHNMSFVYWIKYVTKYIQEVLKLELFLPTHNIVKLYRNTMSFLNIDINFTKTTILTWILVVMMLIHNIGIKTVLFSRFFDTVQNRRTASFYIMTMWQPFLFEVITSPDTGFYKPDRFSAYWLW